MQFRILLIVWSKKVNIALKWWKEHFNKEIVMTKEANQKFKNSTKCWIYGNEYIDNDVKVRKHCHITGKYRGSAQKDCSINLKLHHKILVAFHNLKNYGSHLVMQELGKFNLKIIVLLNGLEQFMSFTINIKLGFIGSFQFLSSSWDNLVKKSDDFKCLS